MKFSKDILSIVLVFMSIGFLVTDIYLVSQIRLANLKFFAQTQVIQNLDKENILLKKRIELNRLQLNTSAILITTSNDTISLSSLINSGTSMLIYIPQSVCSSCVDSILIKLTQIQDKFHIDSTILIGTATPRRLFDLKRVLSAKFSFYSSKDFGQVDMLNLSGPVMIILDSIGQIKDSFILEAQFWTSALNWLQINKIIQ